jgi:DNA polymerase III sliding clamp (beta) subunit (PCNA family)
MQIEFETKLMTTTIKTVNRLFTKGPFTAEDPGLEDCVLNAEDGSVTIESASSGLYVKACFPANVAEPGRVAISRATLQSLVLKSPRCSFKHDPKKSWLHFESGYFQGRLPVHTRFDEFDATRPAQIPELTLSMPAPVAKAAAKRTCLGTTIETLLRMRLWVRDKHMTLSCNDSFRAAAVDSALDDESEGSGEIDVPAVFFNTILQAIDDSRVRLGFNESVFRICGGNFDVCHAVLKEPERPMVDVFGRVEQALQAETPLLKANLNVLELREAVNTVSSINSRGGKDVRVELSFSERNGGQVVAAVNSTVGTGKCALPARELEISTRVPVIVSAKFIGEMLGLLSTDDATFYAWPRMIVLSSRKVGCQMIMPQIRAKDEA